MTHTNGLTSNPKQISVAKRMTIGAGIGLSLIALFLLSVENPDQAWGKFWMIRPLIIVPFAGAMGGLCNYLIFQYYNQVGLNKAVAALLSVIVFIIGLWMGAVLGLDGTLWN